MKKSTRILLIGGIVGAATLVAKLMEQKNKRIDELIEMNNQKVDIIRDLNEMLDFSEEAIEKSKGVITKKKHNFNIKKGPFTRSLYF